MVVADVGTSDVILKKPVFDETRDFFPTWAEWASMHKEQVIGYETVVAGQAVIMTVPENKTLWITSAWVAGHNTGSDITSRLFIRSNTTILGGRAATHDNFFNSITFPQPVRLEEGEKVNIQHNSGTGLGGFHGFLTDKPII